MSRSNNLLSTKTIDSVSMAKSISVEASKVPNAVLKRLLEEVKYESQNNILAYNRTHNRHNRGR